MAFIKQVICAAGAAGLMGLAGAAEAGLQICNDSSDTQSISIGYKGDTDWTSEGWWNIDPGECVTPVGGDLKKRYYYLRAEVDAGPFEGENYFFCTTPTEYTIVGDTDCSERGYDREDFIEIDTGETAKDHTYRITQSFADNAQSGSGLGLEFCNETAYTQAISVGYQDQTKDMFVSEGWWNADPGECVKPIGGALKTQYYYYRAEVDAGDFNGDGYSFCTTPEAYTIEGDTDCESRGYVTEDFAEIDTGPTAKGYTHTLTADNSGIVGGGSDGDSGSNFGLRICNETHNTQEVSVGYEGDQDWTSEGWWRIEVGDCADILAYPLQKQYYYYRAEINGGDFDGENYYFCTTPEAYTIVGDSNCEGRGYDKESFREINVGRGVETYTLTLVPPPGEAGPDTSTTDTGSNASATDDMSATGAGLEICNQTADAQQLSIGYEGEEGWTSEGWWVAEPGQCVTPALDGRPHRYFYYRAEIDGGPFEGQSYFFCTTPEAYTIVGDHDCEARGYDREDFREIDTGGGEGMFTFTLVSDEDRPIGVPKGSDDSGSPGIEFDRNGDDGSSDGMSDPDPEPVQEPEPEPESDGKAPPRRGGSRG